MNKLINLIIKQKQDELNDQHKWHNKWIFKCYRCNRLRKQIEELKGLGGAE